MNKTKRIASIAAAAIMAASMASISAFAESTETAATNATVTIDGASANHTYYVYQLFTGTVSGTTLKNAAFGANLTAAGAKTALSSTATNLTAADAVAGISDASDANAIAASLLANVSGDPTTVSSDASISLAPGYYLVVDGVLTDATDGTPDSYSLNQLIVVSSDTTTITPKRDLPEVVKKVGEESAEADDDYGSYTDSTTNVTYNYNDVADHEIGEAVPFKLYGTLPSDIGNYAHYSYKFTDTLDDGLDAPSADKVVVKIDGTEVKSGTAGLTVSVADNVITVSFTDIKAFGVTKDSKVTVEYTAVLNSNAEAATSNEKNAVNLTFSNNPNETGWTEGDKSDNDENPTPSNPKNPGTPPTNPSTDTTPDDEVLVFTYAIDATKVDQDLNAITDDTTAVFTITNADGKYATVDANGKFTGWSSSESTFSLAADGTFKVIGLDKGTYTITEVTPPAGYNTPSTNSFTVTLSDGIVTTQDWSGEDDDAFGELSVATTAAATFASVEVNDTVAGQADVQIINTTGAQLPTTGGIGTKLFYIGGGAVVLVSGVLLVTKKRMSNRAE